MTSRSARRGVAWIDLLGAPMLSQPQVSALGAVAFISCPAKGSSMVRIEDLNAGSPTGWPTSIADVVAGVAPKWSTTGTRIAVAVENEHQVAVRIDSLAGLGRHRPPELLPIDTGWRIDDLLWSSDDSYVTVLAAPDEADTAVGQGSIRHRDGSDPIVRSGVSGYRRLIELPINGGTQRIVDTTGVNVWEAVPFPAGGYVVVGSDLPMETDWYTAQIGLIQDGHARVLHRSEWQVARPAVSRDGAFVVATEGWSSDRGHLAGGARVVDLATGTSSSWMIQGVDVVEFLWNDDGELDFWGWAGNTTAAGSCDRAGNVKEWLADDHVTRQRSSRRVGQAAVTVAVRQRIGWPAEIVAQTGGSADRVLASIDLSTATSTSIDLEERCQEIEWEADDGTMIQGLLLAGDPDELRTLIVMVHGGPANLWTLAVPVGAVALVQAGFAVLLPNPRGSIGRGQHFARSNLGDPAGAELRDVMTGARACRSKGLVADVAPGIVGGSYGGYLTSCAATFGHDVSAAVVMFGHPDLISARYGSNNPAFYDILLGGPPNSERLALYVERSPVFHTHPDIAPTLILHGDADACTPLGQGEELFMSLREHGVTTELVVYPGEGHGLRSLGVQVDVWTRVAEWFGRHIEGAQS